MLKLILSLILIVSVCAQDGTFNLNILHYNDFHARFEETSVRGEICDQNAEEPCIAGFPRLVTKIREAYVREPQSLLLNGGDSFQGTIWYNLLGWNVTQDFMNMIPHDAHVLGNHEFDNGIEGVVPYLESLDAPVVTANIIDDEEPSIQGLYKPSIIVERGGRSIGIIGVIISTTDNLASTGKLKFTDEVEAVRLEAQKLHDQGVNIVIVLSHCGVEIDRQIALRGGPYIDIIVGGHSHTLLYNGEPPDTSAFRPQDSYPIVVQQESRQVLIVQAAAHTLYLGEINLQFDAGGNLLNWNGNPHYIGSEIEQAPDVLAKVNEYLPLIEEQANEVIGESLVHLESRCSSRECNLGNFICEAFLNSVLDRAERGNWHYAHFCIINQGGIRQNISPGNVSFAALLMSTPFENKVEAFKLRGLHVREMLEHSATDEPYIGARTLQTSGIRAVIDGARPVNDRVVSVAIRCIECEVPRYVPLENDKYYTVVSQSFLGGGGDAFTMISNNRLNVEDVGLDYQVIMKYFNKYSPVFMDTDNRMQISNAGAGA